jgi:Glycosyl hydrolases family 31
MPFQALAAAATLLTVAPHGNRIALKLDRGSAEILWASPGTFRFRRVLEGELPQVTWADRDPVAVEMEDGPDAVRLRTRAIEVTIRKRGVLVAVRRLDGPPLVEDVSEPRSEAAGVVWERQAAQGSEFYGLGPRNDATFGLRGKSVRAESPFLVSTAGYGEFYEGGGTYRFDFTAGDRYRVQGTDIDYCFYYGPTPKEIFEEHHLLHDEPGPWMVSSERFGTWPGLRTSMVRILQGAMSAATAPVFDLGAYNNAPEELKTRARQLGSLVARVTPGSVGTSGFRRQLDTFYGSYVAELQDRGFPVWHPLPFQYPDDREAVRHIDEFMLGDEMLIAPIVDPGNKRSVWLPRGVWTNLETNETVQGPATITVETASLPVWAKNGAIVPLDSGTSMALHYFPKAGGEFFLLEGDIADYSQAHAAPALDFMRLEIESKKERSYQWVVHHVDKPASIGFDERQYREVTAQNALADGTWWWDAANRNLHVRAKVKAGEDCIVNVSF